MIRLLFLVHKAKGNSFTIFRQGFYGAASLNPKPFSLLEMSRYRGTFFIYAEFLPALIMPNEDRITSF